MTDKPEENLVRTVTVKPIGRVKKSQSFFDSPIVQEILGDLVVPLIKSTFLKVLERLLFNDPGESDTRPGSGRISYRSYFEGTRRYGSGPERTDRYRRYQQVRSQFPALEDLIFENEQDATMVVNALYERIEQYTWASVADLYDIVGMEPKDYTYVRFGWNQAQLSQYDLRAHPAGGVRLVMPRPMPIPD